MRAGVLVLAVTAACASSPRVATTSLPPCPEAGDTPGWRLVETDALRFCVPGEWRASGRRAWRGDGGEVEWGLGEPQRQRVRVSSSVVRVPVMGGRPVRSPGQDLGVPMGEIYRSTESVGGASVELWITHFDRTFHTGASWTNPRRVYMYGEAPSRDAAYRQLEVYRTVRMVPAATASAEDGVGGTAGNAVPACADSLVGVRGGTLESQGAGPLQDLIRSLGWVEAGSALTVVEVDRAPELVNPQAVSRATASFYPPELRDQGISETMTFYFLLDPAGTVRSTRIVQGSGYPAFNRAGNRVLDLMAFEPAVHDGCRVMFFDRLTVTFEVKRGQ